MSSEGNTSLILLLGIEGKVQVGRDKRLSFRENLIRDRDSVKWDLAAAMELDV